MNLYSSPVRVHQAIRSVVTVNQRHFVVPSLDRLESAGKLA